VDAKELIRRANLLRTHAVTRAQLSWFDQGRFLNQFIDQGPGVCAGFCAVWLKDYLRRPNALSSERVAHMRQSIPQVKQFQAMRDVADQQHKAKGLLKFIGDCGFQIAQTLPPADGKYFDLSPEGFDAVLEFPFAFVGESVPKPTPFVVSVEYVPNQAVGMLQYVARKYHMWCGVKYDQGMKLFDPNFGEFWHADDDVLIGDKGLIDLYKRFDWTIVGAKVILLSPH
jgi:hypothetical protein